MLVVLGVFEIAVVRAGRAVLAVEELIKVLGVGKVSAPAGDYDLKVPGFDSFQKRRKRLKVGFDSNADLRELVADELKALPRVLRRCAVLDREFG